MATTKATALAHGQAGSIVSGTLADARIPSLAASKITSGTFASARIADDSINLDKLAHLGTDGQVLTSTGTGSAPAFEAIPTSIADGNVVKSSKASSKKASAHIRTNSATLVDTGLSVSIGAASGSNYNKITVSAAGYCSSNAEYMLELYASYNGATAVVMGDIGAPHYRVQYSTGNHFRHNAVWIDDSSDITSGTTIYSLKHQNSSGYGYFVHVSADYTFLVQEIKV
tara:strand:- start:236 stop:919 length:684 start_codon:yes stop_codon:yes gene_type:complete